MSSATGDTARIIHLYDVIGPLADVTAFYVDSALDRLTELADLARARRVLEVGGGTGRYAKRLLQRVLPNDAQYADLEPSRRMRQLARRALTRWSDRATVVDLDDPLVQRWQGSVDRYVATYLLNVMPSQAAVRSQLDHARRMLSPDGLLCLVDQTYGQGKVGRAMASIWMRIYAVVPAALGNCKLIDVQHDYLDRKQWQIVRREIVCRCGFCSEVLVAKMQG